MPWDPLGTLPEHLIAHAALGVTAGAGEEWLVRQASAPSLAASPPWFWIKDGGASGDRLYVKLQKSDASGGAYAWVGPIGEAI